MSNAPEMQPATAAPAAPELPEPSGALTPFNLPELLHRLFLCRTTGFLSLRQGDLRKTIYVRNGRPVFARSSDPEDRLCELLLRRGTLSVRGLEHYSDEMAAAGRRLGGFLIERGLITPAELIEGVQEQVRTIIFSVFRWTQGGYEFYEGPLPTKEVITLEMDALEILWDGLHTVDTWSRIRDAVGGLEATYRTLQGSENDLGLALSDRARNLLQFCSSPVSVGAICDTLPDDNFELGRMIWAFKVLGAMVQVEPGEG